MKAYIGFKFYEDMRNRELIETISDVFKLCGISTSIIVRDFEEWGKKRYSPKKLMAEAFREIDNSDIVVIELSEKGVGLGIEAGYAHGKNKPILCIAKFGSDVSSTLQGIVTKTIFYNDSKEIENEIKNYLNQRQED